jgi:hypothetical protein
VWSWRRDPGATPAVSPAGNGGKKGRFPGESTKETVTPSRGESRVVSAEPVVTTLVCFSLLHARLRVQSAPGFPAPSARERDDEIAKSGQIVPRQCGFMPEGKSRERGRQLRRPLLILKPGQGLAGVAPKQPVVLAGTRIEYGQRGHAPACAASLLLLHGLALLASFFVFLIHVTPPLVLRWATSPSNKVHRSFLRGEIP